MDRHILNHYHPYGDGDSTWILTISRKSLYISVFPKTMVRHYQRIILQVALPLWVLEVHINGITGVTILITESKIQKSSFDTNIGLLLFLRVTSFQSSPISFLGVVHLNDTFHFHVPKNYEFHTSVGVYGERHSSK